MERDKISNLLLAIYDAEKFDTLLTCLQSDEPDTKNSLLQSCGGMEQFSIVLEKWIKAQTQPFLSCKPLDHSSRDCSLLTSLGTRETSGTANSDGWPVMKTSQTRPGQSQKKNKKKIAPQTISALLPSTLVEGNISRQVSAVHDGSKKESGLRENPSVSSFNKPHVISTAPPAWPSLGSTGTSAVRAGSTEREKKKRAVLLPPDPPGPTARGGNIGASAWSTAMSSGSSSVSRVDEDAGPPAVPSSARPERAQSATEGELPTGFPPPNHQLSHSVRAQLETLGVTVTVTDITLQKDKEDTSIEAALNAVPEPITPTPPSDDTLLAARRLGVLYGQVLLLHHSEHFPVAQSIIFLAKLLSVKFIHPGKEITLVLKDPKKFPSCVLNSTSLEGFTVSTLETILPLLQAVGGHVVKALSEVLSPLSPALSRSMVACLQSSQVNSLLSSQQQKDEENLFSTSNVEAFIRPFDDEIDNRNEYKTQIEKNIYNERERCYDDFSNLFRQFQEVNRSDLDGSKTNEFWSLMHSRGTKVLNLNDCNYLWFAKIFKEMLMFHGINLPKSSSSSYGSVGSGPSCTPPLTPTSAPTTGRKSNEQHNHPSVHSTSSSSGLSSSYVKQRHLEERLGQGGGGGSSRRGFNAAATPHNRRSYAAPSHTIAQTSQRMKNMMEALHDPSSHFSGNQQFFFRFILVMDSHRLNVILQDFLLLELLSLLNMSLAVFHSLRSESFGAAAGSRDDWQRLNDKNHRASSQKPSESVKSFTLRVLQLRLLGKFLGLLHFSPFWNTSINGLKESPLVVSAQKYAYERIAVSNGSGTGLPVLNMLQYGFACSSLSLVVPCATSYLRLLSWDRTSILHMTRRDVLSLLQSPSPAPFSSQYLHCFSFFHDILRSDSFDLTRLGESAISKNRVSVVIEIQSFLADFPTLRALHKYFPKNSFGHNNSASEVLPQTSGEAHPHLCSSVEEDDEAPLSSSLIDDSNSGFSPSFLRYLVPDLFEATSLLRQRFTRFCRTQDSGGSERNRPPPLPPPTPKRQAPTLISPHVQHGGPPSSCSAPAPPATPPRQLRQRQQAFSPPRPAPSPTSSSRPFDVIMSPPQSAVGGGGAFSGTSPPLLKSCSGTMNINTRLFSDGSADFFSPSKLRSMSIESESLNDHDNIQLQLEMSFWNQHPQLFSICNFVAEHVSQASRKRLKERVAELVLQAWSCCDAASCRFLATIAEEKGDASASSPAGSCDDDVGSASSRYQNMVENHTSDLFTSVSTETERFLHDFVGEHMISTLNSFLEVYAMSDGVKKTAIKITMRRKESLIKSLFNFYCVYARKKLREVCGKSVQQQQQQQQQVFSKRGSCLAAAPGVSLGPDHEEATDTFSAMTVVLHILGDERDLFQSLKDCLFSTFRTPPAHETSLFFLILYSIRSGGGSDDKIVLDTTDSDELVKIFCTEQVLISVEYSSPLTSNVMKSCEAHLAGFRYFSGYFCGMVSKCTVFCGLYAVRALVCGERGAVSSNGGKIEGQHAPGPLSVRMMIKNNVSVLERLVTWAGDQLNTFSPSCQCTGRMKIDIMKLFTVIISTLFTYDMFLGASQSSAQGGEGSCRPASAVIISALNRGLITVENVSQLVGYSLKQSQLTTIFSLLTKTRDYRAAALSFVGLFLLETYPDPTAELDIDVQGGTWAGDPAVRRIIRNDMSVDLANVIEALAKNI